jgi:hypothetical protein
MQGKLRFFLYILLLSPLLAFLTFQLGVTEYRYFIRPLFWIIALTWFVENRQKLIIPRYLYFLAVYIIYKLAWDFYNYYFLNFGFVTLFQKPHIEIFLILIMIANSHIDKKFINKSFGIIKITILLALIFSLIQLVVDPTFFTHFAEYDENGDYISIYKVRRTSIFSYVDDNSLGLDFLPLFALFVGYALIGKKQLLLFVLSAGLIAFASNTRYVMVGYVLVLFQFALYGGFRLSKMLRLTAIISLCAVGLVFILKFAGYNLDEFILERLFPEQDIKRSSRFFALEIFSQFFYKSIWIGTGQHLTSQIKDALGGYSSQIHVGYLSHLVSYGIIGSFFLFMFWFHLVKNQLAIAVKTKYYGSFFAFVIFLWANVTLVYYSIFTYGLIISLVYAKYFQQSISTATVPQRIPKREAQHNNIPLQGRKIS